ncbi:unnamed protein product, partial [Musa acuminata var. zebrina]
MESSRNQHSLGVNKAIKKEGPRQPRVYNIRSSDFRSVVQQLTGASASLPQPRRLNQARPQPWRPPPAPPSPPPRPTTLCRRPPRPPSPPTCASWRSPSSTPTAPTAPPTRRSGLPLLHPCRSTSSRRARSWTCCRPGARSCR